MKLGSFNFTIVLVATCRATRRGFAPLASIWGDSHD